MEILKTKIPKNIFKMFFRRDEKLFLVQIFSTVWTKSLAFQKPVQSTRGSSSIPRQGKRFEVVFKNNGKSMNFSWKSCSMWYDLISELWDFPGLMIKKKFFAKCWANRSRGSQSRIRNIFCFSVCSMSIFQGKIQFCTIASVCKEIFSSIDFPLRIRPKICCTYLESVTL